MKELKKKVELGKYQFTVKTNREIFAKSVQEFPELFDKIEKNAKSDKIKGINSNSIVELAKSGKLVEVIEFQDIIEEDMGKAIPFVLDLMLKNAGEDLDANEIVEYAKENGIIKTFNSSIWSFLMEGFTLGEQEPKIKFSMK